MARASRIIISKDSSSGLTPWQLVQQNGLGANEGADDFGQSVTLADFNGDGKDDLAVGAPNEAPGSGERSGAVFIYRGGANGVTPSKVLTSRALEIPSDNNYFDFQVLGSDINRDGKADLLVGTPGRDSVFAFKGQADDFAGWTTLRNRH